MQRLLIPLHQDPAKGMATMNLQPSPSPLQRIKNQVRYFNRRFFNPFALSFAGRPRSFWSALRHTGRHSGQEYITPVIAARYEGSFAIPLAYGDHVDWLKNVLAAGGAELIFKGHVYRLGKPEVISIDQGISAFPTAIQSLMRASETAGFVYFHQCTFAIDEPARYAAFTKAFPFERGAWILAAIVAFLLGISRQFRRRR